MSQARTFLIGFLVIALSNAIVLGGVAYNRTAEPSSRLQLTERELRLPFSYGFEEENSGIALRLDWRVFDSKMSHAYYSRWYPTEWLDAAKLAALGFDVSYPLERPESYQHYQKTLSREVLLVLEYDGPIYQQALQKRQQELDAAQALQQQNKDKKEFARRLAKAAKRLKAEQQRNSRLFVIDAGTDYQALRQQYPDKHHYLIARGQVRLNYQGDYKKTPYLSGAIQRLSVSRVDVPKQYATVIRPLLAESDRRGDKQGPRYAVTLNYGKRYEPWLVKVKGL